MGVGFEPCVRNFSALYACKIDQQTGSRQRSYASFQGMSKCCWDNELFCMSQQEHTRQCVSRQWARHTDGMSAMNRRQSIVSPAPLFQAKLAVSSTAVDATLRVLSVFRSRDILESGKKKCSRPKLSRSFRQTSLANAFIAPGYCTGSRSTTCKQIKPVMMRSCCFAVVL